jgi:hypothetical protein
VRHLPRTFLQAASQLTFSFFHPTGEEHLSAKGPGHHGEVRSVLLWQRLNL